MGLPHDGRSMATSNEGTTGTPLGRAAAARQGVFKPVDFLWVSLSQVATWLTAS